MNFDAIYRSFTDEERAILLRALDAIAEDQELTPASEEQAMYFKWLQLGGPEAVRRAKSGEDKQPPVTLDDVLEHFNDAEMALVRAAMLALRAKEPLTHEQEAQYGRYLLIGGEIVGIPFMKEREQRIIERYMSTVLVTRQRPSAA